MSEPNKILVVEDSMTQAIKLQILLEKNNFEVQHAVNGKIAIAEIEDGYDPDLIISDILMPEMDGFQMCKQLKNTDSSGHIPIILLTSLEKIEDVVHGLAVGADNYISKNYREEEIVELANQLISQKNKIIHHADKKKVELNLGDQHFAIEADPARIMRYFISSFQAAVNYSKETSVAKKEIEKLNRNLEKLVEERTTELMGEISQHEKTLKELQKSLEISSQLSKMKTDFLHNLSHEIRTPMNSILGFSDLLMESEISKEETQEYLPYVTDSVESLLKTINNMLEASAISTGELDLKKSEILLETFFEYLLRKPNNVDSNIKTNIDLPLELKNNPVKIYKENIRIVLQKLIDNAFKFTAKGSITLGAKFVDASTIEFSVSDTGNGMAANIKEDIFECFVQLNNKTNFKNPGTGVGLYICKELVEKMGGEINYQSTAGKGSRFFFTIPAELIKKEELEKKSTQKKTLQKKINILLAEDNPINAEFMKIMAQKEGFSLSWAQNGKHVIELYNKNHKNIDLVLMDINMPETNGIDAASAIKNKYKNAIIVALTAYPEIVKNNKLFDKTLQKPIRANELIEFIRHELPGKVKE